MAFLRLNNRDCLGYPAGDGSALEACVAGRPPADGLVFHVPMAAADEQRLLPQGASISGSPANRYVRLSGIPCGFCDGSANATMQNAFADNTIPTGKAPRTLSAWINVQSETNAFKAAFMYGSESAYQGCSISAYGGNVGFLSSNFAPMPGVATRVWHCIIITYDGSVMITNVDGIDVQSDPAASLNTSKGAFYISRTTESSSRAWIGYMADLRIYNRVLSAAEKKAIVNLHRSVLS